MIENLTAIDQDLLLAINGMHSPYFDSFMWLMSRAWAYVLLALVFLYLAYRQGWKQMLLILVAVALTITLADQISSGLLKPLVQRFRPTHTEEIANLIHVVNGYRGGRYGFVSSHAANSFGAAVLLALLFRNRGLTTALIVWASIVSYSRMYLGVHYPGDIICGAAVGVVSAYLFYKIMLIVSRRTRLQVNFSARDAKLMTIATISNVIALLIVATIFDI